MDDLSLYGAAGQSGVPCRADLTDRNDEHRVFVCQKRRGHSGPHEDGDCQWTDETTWVSAEDMARLEEAQRADPKFRAKVRTIRDFLAGKGDATQ